MPTDKELSIRLLAAIEDLYLENMILKDALPEEGRDAMNDVLTEAKVSHKMIDHVRIIFASIRSRIQGDTELAKVIQDLLQVVPGDKNVN
jgi:hypothetical protein